MGYNIFGNKNSNNNGYSPIYQPKIVVNPYNTYNWKNTNGSFYFPRRVLSNWRSGAGNLFYNCEGGSSAVLESISSTGTLTTIASTGFASLLSSVSQNPLFTYSSADQCYYFLLVNSDNEKRLCKMNDTTGALSAIGSSFIPVTTGNWGYSSSVGSIEQGQLILDPVSGHLKYIYNGFYHLINKTTGAIVSQDNPLTTSGITAGIIGCNYITEDLTLACTPLITTVSTSATMIVPRMVGSLGMVGGITMATSVLGYNAYPTVHGTIDSDKLVIGMYPDANSSSTAVPQVVLRSEYDRYLKSIYDYLTIQ